jgi:ABC-type multidrug transport system permease subunit
MSGKKAASTWVAVGIAVAAVTAIAVLIARFLSSIGTSEISFAGWLAMALGIAATLALGIGLMSLVFFSSRHGYDEGPRRDR